MFTAEQVKRFILHPELVVCNAALNYFSDSFLGETDVTLMPLVLERLRQSRGAEKIHLFHAYGFAQTEATVHELLELIQSPAIDDNTQYHLQLTFLNSDLRLLKPYLGELKLDAHWNKRLQDRLKIAEMSNQELADDFESFIRSSYGKYVDEIDSFYGDELVRELSGRRCVDPHHVLQRLDAYNPDDEGYETIYYAQLAGEMKLAAAIPQLCEFFGAEDDVLPVKAGESLVRIGTPAVVSALAEQYLASSAEFYRLYASDVFGNIKLPESEQALLELLPAEEDLTYATKLADGLCQLGSAKGFSRVQAMVEEGYDKGYLSLTESLYAYCVISGTEHPLLPKWRREVVAEAQRLAAREEELNRMARGIRSRSADKLSFGSGLRGEPYVNTNKVGRNDPCPCGSGKKYKKCCGG